MMKSFFFDVVSCVFPCKLDDSEKSTRISQVKWVLLIIGSKNVIFIHLCCAGVLGAGDL